MINIIWPLRAILATGCVALLGCQDVAHLPDSVVTSQNLHFIVAYRLEVPEPSGLSLSKDGLSLWTVSDDDSGLYNISLQGEVLARLQADRRDLEGITAIDTDRLAFISERHRKIVVVDTMGQVLEEGLIAIPGSDNKGPEGLSYDAESQRFFVMQEQPGMLLTLNRQFEELARQELKFAQDYSSISFEPELNRIWVLSDQSKSIHVLDQDLQIHQSFSIDLEQLEGLAIDHTARRIYLISDALEMLFVFEFDAF